MNPLAAAAAYLRSWGWLGPACAALLVVAGALHGGPTQQWQGEAERAFLANEAQSLAAQAKSAALSRPADAAAPDNNLPLADRFDARLDALLGHALKAGLRVAELNVITSAAAGPGLAQPRLELSALGPYAAVRDFLQAALAEDPALSLDQLRLARPQVDATDLQVQLGWTFHARTLGGGKP